MSGENRLEEAKKKYFMTEEEIDNMYQQTRNLIFGNCLPQKGKPVAIITGGQPGSGKSGIVVQSRLDLANDNREHIILDVDTYRGLFKNATELAKEYPEYYSEITDPVVGQIMNKLLAETINGGYNFIFEGTLGSPAIIKTIKSSPIEYDINARLIAVSRFESLLSIFERYLEMNKLMGMGRLTTIDAHDTRYNNFTNIAPNLENEGIEVEVYKRSTNKKVPKQVYKTSEGQRRYCSVLEALLTERMKSYELCMGNAEERLQSIKQEIQNIPYGSIMPEFEKLENILLEELEKRKREEKCL